MKFEVYWRDAERTPEVVEAESRKEIHGRTSLPGVAAAIPEEELEYELGEPDCKITDDGVYKT